MVGGYNGGRKERRSSRQADGKMEEQEGKERRVREW